MLQVSGLYGGVIFPNTVIFSVKEEGDDLGVEEELGRGVVWNYAVLFMEL